MTTYVQIVASVPEEDIEKLMPTVNELIENANIGPDKDHLLDKMYERAWGMILTAAAQQDLEVKKP